VDPIKEEIEQGDFLVADVTVPNFNVFFEIGYAIGKSKRVLLLVNSAIRRDIGLLREIGVLETLGYKPYSNVEEAYRQIEALPSLRALPLPDGPKNRNSPIFIALPKDRTDAEVRIISRVKKQARILFRQFDPTEQVRMSATSALENVAQSHGVILPLISSNRVDFEAHNLRCAFLAGLASALGVELLILQGGQEPVPLDYSDAVSHFWKLEGIDSYINEFAPRITERLQVVAQATLPHFQTPIENLHLGQSAAENEHDELVEYYIQTAEYQRVIRGEVQVVTGRKGAGKTALFYQVRNKIRSNRKNVVMDLNPQGFQLAKLKSVVVDRLEGGTKEHTISAFWEYLIFLELCYKLLEKDRVRHLNDPKLRERYLRLRELYKDDPLVQEGDFAERLLRLVNSIEDRFEALIGDTVLSREQITTFLYLHDLSKLRKSVIEYLQEKSDVWLLFDNIDKGWNAGGVSATDALLLRCLLEGIRKMTNDFRRDGINFKGVVFIRNDVFEILLEQTPDRGKLSRVNLDWTDRLLMIEVMRRRFVWSKKASGENPPTELDFLTIWLSVAVSHLSTGEETSNYLIDRSLMRPRCLLDFLQHCKSCAVNLGHPRITNDDFIKGEEAYSADLIHHIGFEISDVFPEAEDLLYTFIGAKRWMAGEHLQTLLEREVNDKWLQLRRLLLWYGFIGYVRPENAEETYIYHVAYDMKRLTALIDAVPNVEYCINPAFHRGLEITE